MNSKKIFYFFNEHPYCTQILNIIIFSIVEIILEYLINKNFIGIGWIQHGPWAPR